MTVLFMPLPRRRQRLKALAVTTVTHGGTFWKQPRELHAIEPGRAGAGKAQVRAL